MGVCDKTVFYDDGRYLHVIVYNPGEMKPEVEEEEKPIGTAHLRDQIIRLAGKEPQTAKSIYRKLDPEDQKRVNVRRVAYILSRSPMVKTTESKPRLYYR